MAKVKSTCMTAWNAILPVDWYKWLYILIKKITCDVLHPVIKYSHLYQLSHTLGSLMDTVRHKISQTIEMKAYKILYPDIFKPIIGILGGNFAVWLADFERLFNLRVKKGKIGNLLNLDTFFGWHLELDSYNEGYQIKAPSVTMT